MRNFVIMTSRGSSTTVEIEGMDETGLTEACEVAVALYRAPRSWSQTDHTARGTYVHDGADVRIVVIDADNAEGREAVNTVAWMNDANAD